LRLLGLLSLLSSRAIDGLCLAVLCGHLSILIPLVLPLFLGLFLAFFAFLWRAFLIFCACFGLPFKLAFAIFALVFSASFIFLIVSCRAILIEALTFVTRSLVSFTVLVRRFGVLRCNNRGCGGYWRISALHLLLHLNLCEADHGCGGLVPRDFGWRE